MGDQYIEKNKPVFCLDCISSQRDSFYVWYRHSKRIYGRYLSVNCWASMKSKDLFKETKAIRNRNKTCLIIWKEK